MDTIDTTLRPHEPDIDLSFEEIYLALRARQALAKVVRRMHARWGRDASIVHHIRGVMADLSDTVASMSLPSDYKVIEEHLAREEFDSRKHLAAALRAQETR